MEFCFTRYHILGAREKSAHYVEGVVIFSNVHEKLFVCVCCTEKRSFLVQVFLSKIGQFSFSTENSFTVSLSPCCKTFALLRRSIQLYTPELIFVISARVGGLSDDGVGENRSNVVYPN